MGERSLSERIATIEQSLKDISRGIDEIKAGFHNHDREIGDLQLYNANFKGRLAAIGSICVFVGGILEMAFRMWFEKAAH